MKKALLLNQSANAEYGPLFARPLAEWKALKGNAVVEDSNFCRVRPDLLAKIPSVEVRDRHAKSGMGDDAAKQLTVHGFAKDVKCMQRHRVSRPAHEPGKIRDRGCVSAEMGVEVLDAAALRPSPNEQCLPDIAGRYKTRDPVAYTSRDAAQIGGESVACSLDNSAWLVPKALGDVFGGLLQIREASVKPALARQPQR